ncbi:MAG: hypothetical protein KGS61_10950 [Verrucomicrobia bacterium]|nr:hypothetical protein [Verrucomicrobiota bacterium]
MTTALGELELVLVLAVLTGLSGIRRQVLALPILLVGVCLLLLLGVTILFQVGWPYRVTGVSIYVAFFVGAIFSLAGGIGIVVHSWASRTSR